MLCDDGGILYAEILDPSSVCERPTFEGKQGNVASWQPPRVSPCGLARRVGPPSDFIAVSPAVKQLLTNHWMIYGLLLFCGPIGLPLLWLSPRFSRLAKSAITLLLMSITLILPIIIYWYSCELLLRPLATALGR